MFTLISRMLSVYLKFFWLRRLSETAYLETRSTDFWSLSFFLKFGIKLSVMQEFQFFKASPFIDTLASDLISDRIAVKF